MSDKVLVGYSTQDHEEVAISAFFKTWTTFNRKLDRTITGTIPSLHDRVGLFRAYIAWKATPNASDDLIV